MEFRVKNKYSRISPRFGENDVVVAAFLSELEHSVIFYEIVKEQDLDNYWGLIGTQEPTQASEPAKTEFDQFCENCETILNKDPFGDKLSGVKLGDIFITAPEWVAYAKNNLKNLFIKNKIEDIDCYNSEHSGALDEWKRREK